MKTIYIYVLEEMAEWEIGNILQAVSMEPQIKAGKKEFQIKTVGNSVQPVHTIGGLTLVPDCSLDEIDYNSLVALLLPGANTWNDESNKKVLEIACSLIDKQIMVGAICGATLVLANLGVLNNLPHTSNSLEYLKLFSKQYTGDAYYRTTNSCVGNNVITASVAGGLDWAKDILDVLEVYESEVIDTWYAYYSTGDSKYLMMLMNDFFGEF